MSKLNYKTSKDYKRLKELLDNREAVIVLYEGVEPHVAFKQDGIYFWINGVTTARGFFSFCQRRIIEFIEPNGEG